jgi:2-keto-4-pentenoate hydratase
MRASVATVMPAFELIEDRHAQYKSTKALSLIADNAWNAGIVVGPETPLKPGQQLDGLPTRLETGSGVVTVGATDDPFGALAWIANLAVSRGTPLQAGQIVMTGSTIATQPIAPGERFVFSIEGLGTTVIAVD